MRSLQLRTALPWLIGLSLLSSAACLALAVYLGLSARTVATRQAIHEIAAQSDVLARQIESDLTLFDLSLREAAAKARISAAPGPGQGPPRAGFPELPLTARYSAFMNVLNEVGDVVADSRPNVSRPSNFEGRDYFQGHLKNPADILMIGRPFGIAPGQRASIPLSRRVTRPDGEFGGVAVIGVQLTWLSDILSRPAPGPHAAVTVRRDDGLILMRNPSDPEVIGRYGGSDQSWQDWISTGISLARDSNGGVRLFRRISGALVLELSISQTEIGDKERSWLLWLPPLAIVPGVFIVILSLLAQRTQQRAKRIEAGAEAADHERRRLFATMNHELRTPLTSILGHAELIAEEGGLSKQQTGRLAQLTEAGTLMHHIVNRITDGARAGAAIEAPVPCDLDQLIYACLGIVEAEAAAKSLRLDIGISPSAPKRVMLARTGTKEILINLLKNAVKFTSAGTVAVRVSGDTTRLLFEVADTGQGIHEDNAWRLFREFDRLGVSHVEGTGIGLTISKRLVFAMGGQIGHRNNPGGGSIFWFELPTAPVTEGPPAQPVTTDPLEPRSDEMRHLKILLADDLDMTRGVTADYLRTAGHVVSEVPDGEAAVAEVQKRDFDVVLTDMRMPVFDGLEATRRIRALAGHRGRTPVVLVTADPDACIRGASGLSGVDVCLMKPFKRAELLAAVAKAARLTPVPDASPADAVKDGVAFAELRQSLDAKACTDYLNGTAHRIEDLIALLDSPGAADNPTLRDAVHDLTGLTGLIGLTALSGSLQGFDLAKERGALIPTLRAAAEEALRTIRSHV